MVDLLVPNRSSKSGNTIQISPAIHWFFTWNTYPKDWLDHFISNSSIDKYILGEEIGANGNKHIQGQVSFKHKLRPKELFPKEIHWEKTKKLQSAIDYCSKEQKYEIKGYKLKFVQRIDKLFEWENKIIDIISSPPDDRSINWFWEPNGCAGKTTFSKYLYTHYPHVITLSGKGSDMLNGVVTYNEKKGCLPEIILINIPRSTTEFVSYGGIEAVKDMYFFSGKYEGGMICGECPHVICFANEEPEYEKMSQDRWRVQKIND